MRPSTAITLAILLLSALVVGACGAPAVLTPTPSPSPQPTRASTPTPMLSAAPVSPTPEPPIDTAGWTTYTSSQYEFTVSHPADWRVLPATRAWAWEADVGKDQSTTPGADHFTAADQSVRISAWSIPLDPGTTLDGVEANLAAWVEDYCRRTGNTSCSGIADRAVPMCLERRDCHPALLVPFKSDVQAFFAGGIYDPTAMTVVAIWRGESAPAVASYGGSQRLLEAFLSTIQVFPNPNP